MLYYTTWLISKLNLIKYLSRDKDQFVNALTTLTSMTYINIEGRFNQ